MPTFSVRSIIQWTARADNKKKFLYEERITLWNATSLDEAIDMAEIEAEKYSANHVRLLDNLQGYFMYDEVTPPNQGVEIFSLLRESDLPPKAYVRAFFVTGFEREGDYVGDYKAKPNSSPKHPPAPRKRFLKPRKGGA